MSLRLLLPDGKLTEFVRHTFLKVPYSQSGRHPQVEALLLPEAFRRACTAEGADVVVAREGQSRPDAAPRTWPQVEAALADGWTVLVRKAERHDPRLAELAAGFAADFLAPVDIHLYATPAGGRGFGWHYDAEDVFLVQAQGSKEYALRKNTVNPWPLAQTLPDDMHYQREIMPLLRCSLAPGDWLYLPAGYWHMGRAVSDSLTLAIGVMTRPALDALEFLRDRLQDSLLWRQRLPVAGAAQAVPEEELLQQVRGLLASLAADIERTLTDDRAAVDFLRWRRASGNGSDTASESLSHSLRSRHTPSP